MIRCLILDTENAGLDLAMRASAAGHEVRLFRYSRRPTKFGTGFGKSFELVDDWKVSMPWAREGLVFMTGNSRYLTELDRFREMGYRNIWGPTAASAKLEINRSAGMEAMAAAGIDVPPFQMFDSLEAAEAFAKKSDEPWVFKPAGDSDDKSLTMVSRDPADLVGWLQRQIKAGKQLKGKAMLQRKVKKMAEIGVSAWMGSDGFLPEKFHVCHEFKPLHAGDIGMNTGEQGSVAAYTDLDKLATEMLLPLEPVFRALGHRGDTAVGAMVDEDGKAWPLEFTCRTGHPICWIQAASHRGDPIQWMKDALEGKDSLKVSNDVAIGVVLSQPTYPFELAPPEKTEGIPIQGADDVLPDLHLVEAMRGRGPVMEGGRVVERPAYETAGEYVAVVTALGKTVSKARKRVYGTIDQIHYPDMGYRNDIGVRLEKELPKLHAAGYASDIEF